MNDKHEFKVGDDCPFCDGKLYLCGEVLRCCNDECHFNKVTFR
jgi:hypothetical protein